MSEKRGSSATLSLPVVAFSEDSSMMELFFISGGRIAVVTGNEDVIGPSNPQTSTTKP